MEEQKCSYLIHSRENKSVHAFPKCINKKINVTERLKFENTYYNIEVQHTSNYVTEAPSVKVTVSGRFSDDLRATVLSYLWRWCGFSCKILLYRLFPFSHALRFRDIFNLSEKLPYQDWEVQSTPFYLIVKGLFCANSK